MKALVTVVDDNGNIICKDRVLMPIKDEVIDYAPDQPALRDVRFGFSITQLILEHKEAKNGSV